MNKRLFIVFCLLIITVRAIAQKPVDIVKKYINDTTGFAAYPDAFLLDSIKPAKTYKSLEINTINFMYRARGDKRSQEEYQNLYRYPASAEKLADTIVLTKCDVLRCFDACLCAAVYPWYISAETTDDRLVTVGDTTAMKTFLGKIDNRFNAYLWLILHHMQYREIPVKTSHFFKFKKVKNGFLICYRNMMETAPLTNADLTYFISKDFKITFISKRNEVVNKNVSFKI